LSALRIAVVGSGISGLSAAWLLSQRHEVSLFEADGRIGGHCHTVDCEEGGRQVPVDTGFIVFNPAAYPNLTALFDYLDVATSETVMGFSVSMRDGRYEYAGRGLQQIVGGAANLFDPGHWRMLAGIARFFRQGLAQADTLPDHVTLGQFLKDGGYGPEFVTRHLLPMAAAIWSSEPGAMADYPARALLRFFNTHGLLQIKGRPKWRTVTGGSRQYVSRLLADSSMQVFRGRGVVRAERRGGQVTLAFADGTRDGFDHVVIATHADQALAMLAQPTAEEAKLLSVFRYSRNRAVLHRDATLMPKRRWLWSSWNYVENGGCAVSYWMNALQPLNTATDYFVTLNPHREPRADLVIRDLAYTHPVFSAAALAAQKDLWSLQGVNNTWFCGAHFGAGFHEDGLQSGLAVAEQLGGLARPWTVANPSGRIAVREPSRRYGRQLEAAE